MKLQKGTASSPVTPLLFHPRHNNERLLYCLVEYAAAILFVLPPSYSYATPRRLPIRMTFAACVGMMLHHTAASFGVTSSL